MLSHGTRDQPTRTSSIRCSSPPPSPTSSPYGSAPYPEITFPLPLGLYVSERSEGKQFQLNQFQVTCILKREGEPKVPGWRFW